MNKVDELREVLVAAGLPAPDDLTLAKLAKAAEASGGPAEQMAAMLAALGISGVDAEAAGELAELAADTESEEEFVDAIFIGSCPQCGSEKTQNCEAEPGIESFVVGKCLTCGWLWCSECGAPLTRKDPECRNPDCFLNEPETDEDMLEDDHVRHVAPPKAPEQHGPKPGRSANGPASPRAQRRAPKGKRKR